MKKLNRREFIRRSQNAGLGLGLAVGATGRASAKPVSPNDKIVVGIIGIRGRGMGVGLGFATRPDCDVAYLADPDASLFETPPPAGYVRYFDKSLHGPRVQAYAKAQGRPPKTVQDFRRMLDDKDVDAVIIATPDHWHAPATVWACQAGKDVFVEKPASHNPWEGRKMVEAARKYKRVVQHGTQSRSAPELIAAREYIRSGKLGTIHFVRVHDLKHWGNIQGVPDSDPPPHLDWDMWNGPAPQARYNFNLWEWWNHYWRYSGGDIINDSIHQLDLARWLVGKDYPKSVYSTGGRWGEAGIYETPDTQVAVYDFGDLVMNFEMTLYTPYMEETRPEYRDADVTPYWLQNTSRVELYGTKALMVVGRHGGGWQVFEKPKDNQPVVAHHSFGRRPDFEHYEDFCRSIRSRSLPSADIEEGHRSTLLSQFANISYRLGGEKLIVDPKTETFTNSPQGNQLLKREYRKPWVVPDQV